MSAIDQLFERLRARNEKAFIPFVTAGDPDLDLTRTVIQQLGDRGCHLCEIGIPYSDPIADGPVIQASYTRALARRTTVRDILSMLASLTPQTSMPLVSMVSYAIVLRHGLEQYVTEAKQAGLSGMIVPDLLIEEAEGLSRLCTKHDLSLIQLVTPTTPRERAVRIANSSTGFLYYVSVTGITGQRDDLPADVVDQVGWLREQTSLPICIGFGISRPQHVRMLRSVADGIIVGSALVRHLARLSPGDQPAEPRETVLADLDSLVSELIAALNAETHSA
jgi:tryptophan synthase alpha chain